MENETPAGVGQRILTKVADMGTPLAMDGCPKMGGSPNISSAFVASLALGWSVEVEASPAGAATAPLNTVRNCSRHHMPASASIQFRQYYEGK